MQAIIEVLEQELEEAFEVKNKKSLHRYIVLLTENIVKKESYEKEQLEIETFANLLKTTDLTKSGEGWSQVISITQFPKRISL